MTDQLRSELGQIDLPGKDIHERYEELRLWADKALAENARLLGLIEKARDMGLEIASGNLSGYDLADEMRAALQDDG